MEIYSAFSHILKNPLVGASGYIDYLFKGYAGPLSEKQADPLGRAKDAIVQLQNVVDIWMDLLAFDLGLIHPHREALNLNAEMARWMREIRLWVSGEGRTLSWHSRTAPLWVLLDSKWIRTALREILSNAVRSSPRRSRIHVRWTRSGKKAVIQIEDEGPGVPLNGLEWIFQPLTQLRRPEGPPCGNRGGLGLALVRHIVQAHHGSVRAALRRRGGLRISLVLPLAEAKEIPR